MAIPSSITHSFDAVLATTLWNWRATLEDNISTANALLFHLMRKQEGGYKAAASIGDACIVPLMYEMGEADVYSGYDTLPNTPQDGITAAKFEWRQMAASITISRLEERKNSGEAQMINLLEAKTNQAVLEIQDLFGKALLQGDGPHTATSITTPYTSSLNGASFIDPLPLMVKYDPTSSTTIGNINQATYTWWANQFKASSASTYKGFLKELRSLYNLCSKGPGGAPNMTIFDRLVFELYEAALADSHQNPSYAKADIPFENITFRGSTVVWDEFIPDVANGTAASIPVAASGSGYMLNTKYWGIQYDPETNWITTPFQRRDDQDAKSAHILWLGTATVSNRRKQGVLGSVDTTIAS